ncbi:MAG: hypothetical protein V3S20_03780 [Dehalococcoidia bacterium]
MKWQVVWPDSVSGWCFWASLAVLIGVVGMIMVGAGAGLNGAEGVAEVLLKVVQFGFVAVVALFLAGVVCSVVSGRRTARKGRWQP